MAEPRTDQFVPDEDREVELTEDEVILPDDAPVDDEDRHVESPADDDTDRFDPDAADLSEGR